MHFLGEKRSLQLLLYSSNQFFKVLNKKPNQNKVLSKIPVGPWLHLWVSIDQQHLLQHRLGA